MRHVGPAVAAAATVAALLLSGAVGNADHVVPGAVSALVTGDCATGADAGGSFQQATSIPLPVECGAAVSGATGDLEDWYRFPAARGGTITIGFRADTGPEMYQLCLTSPTGVPSGCAASAAFVNGVVGLECDALAMAGEEPAACTDDALELVAREGGDWRLSVRGGPVTNGQPGTILGYGLAIVVV